MNDEGAIVKTEVLIHLRKHPKKRIRFKTNMKNVILHLHWKYFLFESVRWPSLLIAVHEDVPTCRVTMEVTEEKYLSRLLSLFHHQLCVVIDGIKFCARAYPLSIEVLAY